MYAADAVTLLRGGSVWLSEGWGSRGNQSEIAVTFPLPSAFATFGIILNTAASSTPLNTPNFSSASYYAATVNTSYVSSSFASAPPSIEAISSATIDINDSKNRSILTRGATQAALGKEFGVTICTRGR